MQLNKKEQIIVEEIKAKFKGEPIRSMPGRIITNNKPREILYGYQLPEKLRKEFDYLSDEEYELNEFFKYRGYYYDIYQFIALPKNNGGWNAYHADSAFSAIVIKFIGDDQIIVGLQLC